MSLPRLNSSPHTTPAGSTWPLTESGLTTPLFVGRREFRKLVVMLDAEILGDENWPWGKEQLLAGLLTHDVVTVVRYSDTGPPDSSAHVTDDYLGKYVPGWVVLGNDDGSGVRSVITSDGDTVTETAIFGNGPEVAATDTNTQVYSDLDPAVAANRRRADATAAMVADSIGADLFVTSRPYLHLMTWSVSRGVTYADLDDALTLLSLYLRSQQIFTIMRDPKSHSSHTMNRGLFFWIGARELLPSAWRWFSACVQHSTQGGSDSLINLGQSTLQRVQRALQVRDAVHVALDKPQNNDTADEALTALDLTLLLLMGAVDATARVAHAVIGLTTRPYRAGWQNQDWLSQISASAPDLGGLFIADTDESNTLTILRLLRNAIHGEALTPLGIGVGRMREGTLIGLPASQRAELTAAFSALGGTSDWGISEIVADRLHADPGTLLEHLMPRVLAMLNRIMDATPVERLDHVVLGSGDLLPPSGTFPNNSFDERTRMSIRWQLGL